MRNLLLKAFVVFVVVGPITSLVLWALARWAGVSVYGGRASEASPPYIGLRWKRGGALHFLQLDLPWVTLTTHYVYMPSSDFSQDTLDDMGAV